MKRTNVILFALFLFLSAGQLWAQNTLPYKTAAIFEGDTLRYLEYNYSKRHEQYIGKTVGEILEELEYPVLYIVESARRGDKLISLKLGIRQKEKDPTPVKDYYINVGFENPPVFKDFLATGYHSQNNYVFTTQIYNLIKDLKISGISSNQFILKDPELLELQKRVHEEMHKRIKREIEGTKISEPEQ
ncbi:MAG: hypothetical protein LBK97_03315 [Prevotellaceae bacterium]|jgi:hypothetical protein|nr:hypothetical protein [Prevotellaceae bacterium]